MRLVQVPSARYSMMPLAMLPATPSASDGLLALEPERRRHASRRPHGAEHGRSDGSPPCARAWDAPGSTGTALRCRPRCRAAPPRRPDYAARRRRAPPAQRRRRHAPARPRSVSSKSSPCAAVPFTSAAAAALSVRVADRGARPVVVAAAERRLHVVLVARRDAQTDDIDGEIDALLADGVRHRRASTMRCAELLGDRDFRKFHSCVAQPRAAEARNAVDRDHDRRR